MKFSDLEFKPHPVLRGMSGDALEILSSFKGSAQAIWVVGDVRISIVFGEMFYSNGVNTYEVMITEGLDDNPVSDEPLGYLTKGEVEDFINDIT